MDRIEKYRQLIEQVLNEYASLSEPDETVQTIPVFDRQHDRYLLIVNGREMGRRVHFCLAHLEIINEKVWIYYDGTEIGFGNQLLAAGIPKEHIVPAFMSPEMRQYTEFAIA